MKLYELLNTLNTIVSDNPSAVDYDVVFTTGSLDLEEVVDCGFDDINKKLELW